MTNPSSSNTSGRKGRKRDPRAHEAILEAALTLLQQEGYAALTIEGIAGEAGVGKQTIYRWWESKSDIVLEAFANRAMIQLPIPDRGNVREDLTDFLSQLFSCLSQESGDIVRALMAEALLSEEFAYRFRTVFISQRRAALQQIFERGVNRGELIASLDYDIALDLIYGPMWYRLLNRHGPLDEAFAQQLAEILCRIFAVERP